MSESANAEPDKKPCKKCKEEIDAKAEVCPYCRTKNPHVSNAQGCLALIILAFVVFVIAGIFIPESDTTKKEGGEESKTEETNGIDNPDFIPFEYINIKTKQDIKMSADVLVQLPAEGLPTKKNLKATGAQVVSLHDARNNFVDFYLPGMYGQTGPYAIYKYYRDKDESGLAINTANLPRKYIKKEIPGPTQYSSLEKMVESKLGYDWQMHIQQGKNPPHLKISQGIFHKTFESSPESGREVAQKGLVYGILNTFIHTDLDKIKVTSVPFIRQKLSDRSGPEADNYKIVAELTRAQALDLLSRALGIDSFNQLVGAEYGGVADPDAKSNAFERIYYNNGKPGRERFVAAIMAIQ